MQWIMHLTMDQKIVGLTPTWLVAVSFMLLLAFLTLVFPEVPTHPVHRWRKNWEAWIIKKFLKASGSKAGDVNLCSFMLIPTHPAQQPWEFSIGSTPPPNRLISEKILLHGYFPIPLGTSNIQVYSLHLPVFHCHAPA